MDMGVHDWFSRHGDRVVLASLQCRSGQFWHEENCKLQSVADYYECGELESDRTNTGYLDLQ